MFPQCLPDQGHIIQDEIGRIVTTGIPAFQRRRNQRRRLALILTWFRRGASAQEIANRLQIRLCRVEQDLRYYRAWYTAKSRRI